MKAKIGAFFAILFAAFWTVHPPEVKKPATFSCNSNQYEAGDCEPRTDVAPKAQDKAPEVARVPAMTPEHDEYREGAPAAKPAEKLPEIKVTPRKRKPTHKRRHADNETLGAKVEYALASVLLFLATIGRKD